MNLNQALDKAWTMACKHRVIGLGSGATIIPFIETHRQHNLDKDVVFIPTSLQAKSILDRLGLCSGDLNSFPVVDITVDGCDAFDPDGNMVKGGGGCMLQEKMVAEASTEYVILAHERKRVQDLLSVKIPIEVHPFAAQSAAKKIRNGLSVIELSTREGSGKMGPVITDSGNIIIDVVFEPKQCVDKVNRKLLQTSGIMETGLFLDMSPNIISFSD